MMEGGGRRRRTIARGTLKAGAITLVTIVMHTGCSGAERDTSSAPEDQVRLGAAVGALTCITVQNTGPITSLVEDTQISFDVSDPTKASTTYGSIQQVNAGYVGTTFRRILMKFDLGAAGVPQGSAINSATLTFRMIQSLGKNPVDIYGSTAHWAESSATWNEIASATNAGLGTLLSTVPTLGVPNNSDVSVPLPNALVETWIDSAQNTGLIWDHPTAGRTLIGSSEAPTVNPRPKLAVCYEPPSCTDGRQNQGEDGVDCGGPCPTGCCAHAACLTGAALDLSVCTDPCIGSICGVDPYCCSTQWDNVCVGEVASICAFSACSVCGDDVCDQTEDCSTCGADCGTCPSCGDGLCQPENAEHCGTCAVDCGACSCDHDACTVGPPLDPVACSDPCVGQVCVLDSYCCNTDWDHICIDEISSICGSLSCAACGDGVCGPSENCTTCGTDCGPCPYCGDGVCSPAAGESCSACGVDCGACACAHDKCIEGGALDASTCSDPCIGQICSSDPYCCNVAWDEFCVAEVMTICASACGT